MDCGLISSNKVCRTSPILCSLLFLLIVVAALSFLTHSLRNDALSILTLSLNIIISHNYLCGINYFTQTL